MKPAELMQRMDRALAAYRQGKSAEAALALAFPERWVSPADTTRELNETELEQLMVELRERFGGDNHA